MRSLRAPASMLSPYKDKDTASPLQIKGSHFNTQFSQQNTALFFDRSKNQNQIIFLKYPERFPAFFLLSAPRRPAPRGVLGVLQCSLPSHLWRQAGRQTESVTSVSGCRLTAGGNGEPWRERHRSQPSAWALSASH